MTSGVMDILETTEDTFALIITTGHAHQLHEQGQVLRASGEHGDVEINGKVKPLSYMRKNIRFS